MSEYKLSFKDFTADITRKFQDLAKEGSFTDVTLVSDDLQEIAAHRLVLSSSSPVLCKLLQNRSHTHPLLLLRCNTFSDNFFLSKVSNFSNKLQPVCS